MLPGLSDLGTEVLTGIKRGQSSAQAQAGDFSREFLHQILGHKSGDPVPTAQDVEKKEAADREFSDQAWTEARARVQAIYAQHRAKTEQEAQVRKQAEQVQKNEQNLAQLNDTRKKRLQRDVAAATGKASAETGASYGSGE